MDKIFYSCMGLNDTQYTKVKEIFSGYDEFAHMSEDSLSMDKNQKILRTLAKEYRIYRIDTGIDTYVLWKNLEEMFPEYFPDFTKIKYLDRLGFSWTKFPDKDLVLFDWLPNNIVAGHYKENPKWNLKTMKITIEGIEEIWLFLNTPFGFYKWYLGETRFFFSEDDQFTGQYQPVGYVDWVTNMNGVRDAISSIIPIEQLLEIFNILYKGRKYLCTGQGLQKDLNFIAICLFLNMQEEFILKMKGHTKNGIVFFTYDPRISGGQILTESPLYESTSQLSAHEFNMITRNYPGYSIQDPRNKNAILKRYGNCLYTIINDYFLDSDY